MGDDSPLGEGAAGDEESPRGKVLNPLTAEWIPREEEGGDEGAGDDSQGASAIANTATQQRGQAGTRSQRAGLTSSARTPMTGSMTVRPQQKKRKWPPPRTVRAARSTLNATRAAWRTMRTTVEVPFPCPKDSAVI